MKAIGLTIGLLFICLSVRTNDETLRMLNGDNKVFLITLDGLRWQEVFKGADPTLLTTPVKTAEKHTLKQSFRHSSEQERRRLLLPFFWNTIASRGQLFGNRRYGNKMNVANPYALSYPGYNELLTGRVDYTLFDNGRSFNTNLTVLDFLNSTVAFRGKVAAFSSWNAFPYILSGHRSQLFLNTGQSSAAVQANHTLLNEIQQVLSEEKATRDDQETFLACKAYIAAKKPSVVLLSFGGTDEAAHKKQYDEYLRQAVDADRMIGELWHYVQSLPEYAGKTTFIITTDHGRGASANNWHTHGTFTAGSSQTWMALLGNGITGDGEQKAKGQLYQKDLKNIILQILSR